MATYYIVADGTAALPNEIDAGSVIDLDVPPYASGDVFIFRGSADKTTSFADAGATGKTITLRFEEDSTGGGYDVALSDNLIAAIEIDPNIDISDVNVLGSAAGEITLIGGDNVAIGAYQGSALGDDTVTLGLNATVNGDIDTGTQGAATINVGDGSTITGNVIAGNDGSTISLGTTDVQGALTTGSGADDITLAGTITGGIETGAGADTLRAEEIDPALSTTLSLGSDNEDLDSLYLEVSDPTDKSALESALTTAGYTQSGKTWTSPDGAAPTSADVAWGNATIQNAETITVVCFACGTRIETDQGDVPIEDLAPGDMVRTLDHGVRPIRWIGSTTVPAIGTLAPVRIKKGALGNTRDLVVSPQHRMMLSGWQMELFFGEPEVLAPAKSLVNDTTIRRETGGTVQYFHMLFEDHEIIFAEGAPSESFYPGKEAIDSVSAETRAEILTLFPELEHDTDAFGPLARMSLRRAETRLAVQALSEVRDVNLAKFH